MLSAGLALAGTSLAGAAEAQLLREREGATVAFEAKAGPYLPALAEPVAEGGLPAWDQVYGGGRTRVLVVLGLEVQPLRGDAGTLSVGANAGFIGWDGALADEAAAGFNVVPLTFTLGYRFDLLVDRTFLPVAPYVRGGLAYYLWWGDGVGPPPEDDEEAPLRSRAGLSGSAGLSIALNDLDPHAAAQLDAAVGIETTYLFFEGQLARVDGFGDGDIDLSDTTWFGGLMLEL
jgi:hypothetical protein